MRQKVLIADDHPLSRRAIRSVLEASDQFELCGEAVDGREAIELCRKLVPDLILMDIRMPGLDGLEATRRIRQQFPSVKVVILTVSDTSSDLFAALQYGAQGYLLKNMNPDDWLSYLLQLMNDQIKPSSEWSDRLFQRFRTAYDKEHESVSTDFSPREMDIITCVIAGDTNKQIAEKLSIAENTVKNHMKHILEKCGLDNRVQLTAYAIREGWTHNIHNRE